MGWQEGLLGNGLESVACAKDVLYVLLTKLAEFSPQVVDVRLERVGPDFVVITPQAFEQGLPRHCRAGVLKQRREQFVFLAREHQGAVNPTSQASV